MAAAAIALRNKRHTKPDIVKPKEASKDKQKKNGTTIIEHLNDIESSRHAQVNAIETEKLSKLL